MQSRPLVSPQDCSTPAPWHYREVSGHSSFNQLIQDDYTDTQMEHDMEGIFDKVAAAYRSRANVSSSAEGDSIDSERPAKRR